MASSRSTARGLRWALTGALIAACAPDDPGGDVTFSVRDSARVAIAETFGPAAALENRWRPAAAPKLDIGTAAGSPELELFGVVDAVRLSDGTIAVANAGSSEVRFFGPNGELVASVGAPGAGPGEFAEGGLAWLQALPGDSLAVWDARNRRLSVLTAGRELAAELRLQAIPGVARRPEPVGVVGARLVVVTARQAPASREVRETLTFWSYARDGTPERALLTVPGVQNFEFSFMGGQSIDELPFGAWPAYVVDGSRLYVTTGDAYEVRVVDPHDAATTRWRYGAPLPLLTDSMIEAYEAELMADAPDSPEGRAAWRQWFDDVPYPDRAAVFGRLVAGQDGALWAAGTRGTATEPRTWWRFGIDGRLQGSLRPPEGFALLDAGATWILGRWTDDLGVEHVRLYEIQEVGAG